MNRCMLMGSSKTKNKLFTCSKHTKERKLGIGSSHKVSISKRKQHIDYHRSLQNLP